MIVKPEIIQVPDRPTVVFREAAAAFDFDKEMQLVMKRAQWVVGTVFDVQFREAGYHYEKVLKFGTFLVSSQAERVHTNHDNPDRPMTMTLFPREYRQLGEWTVIEEPEAAEDVSSMAIPQLQKLMKELTGAGFKPGTSREEMVSAVREAQQSEAA